MSEPSEFEVTVGGAPKLDDSQDVQDGPDQYASAATALIPLPGWTQDEAARVVGGMVANATLVMYVVRWRAAPAPELWPLIAGDPPREFPLLGAGLAPVLDFLAPKGSLPAIGVSLTAGAGEVIGAMARRWEVVNTAPPPPARPAAAPAEPRAAAAPTGEGFRFTGEGLRILREQDGYAVGMGIEA